MSDVISPAKPELRAILAQALTHLDRSEAFEAERLLFAVLAEDDNNADALQLMGVLRRAQGRDLEAESFYRRSLAIDPDKPQVHYNLGRLLKSSLRFDEAVQALKEAIRLKPNYADAHLELALVLSEKGDHEGAVRSCRDALRLQPNYLLAKQCLANALIELDRPKEAERLLRQSLDLGIRDERQAAAMEHNLGVALQKQDRHQEALPFFDSAQRKVPELSAVDYNRGNAFQYLGRFEEAVECYRRAVLRNPLDFAAHDDLNRLLYVLGRDDDFLVSFDDAARLYPDSGQLALGKANFLFQKGEYLYAREGYERAARLVPNWAGARTCLGLTLMHLSEFDAAIAEHESAIRLEPDAPHSWRNLAQTFLASGDSKAALDAAEQALARDPDGQLTIAVWGLALRKLGEEREFALNDTSTLVRVYEIPAPEPYASIADFNGELNTCLDQLHTATRECIDQTLRAGTQTFGRLFGMGYAPVDLLADRIRQAVADYIASMPADDTHPLSRRRKPSFEFATSWSSRLRDCGFHTNHVHPKGWISSAYYVALPDAVEDAAGKQGWIKFGEPNMPYGLTDAVRRTIEPRPGLLVLFPSYMWHGTIPFHSEQSRTTIAFDAVPK
jgi:tetratricopeptide (TPR) repeat protein